MGVCVPVFPRKISKVSLFPKIVFDCSLKKIPNCFPESTSFSISLEKFARVPMMLPSCVFLENWAKVETSIFTIPASKIITEIRKFL